MRLAKLFLLPWALFASLSHAFCFDEAAARYSVDPKMLKAIAQVESKMTNGIVSAPNSNGTYDIGVMQINSSHLGRLGTYGITKDALLNDACLNVKIGAWVLAQNVARYGNTWRAVGAYNAGNEDLRVKYAAKVQSAYFGIPIIARDVSADARQSRQSIRTREIRVAEVEDKSSQLASND